MTKTTAKVEAKDFVHLHNHTHYSLLDGLQKVPEMLDRVQALGMEAVAITDHGTLSGAIEFYKEAKNRGIKPIIGMETYVAPRKHTDKEGKKDANPFHLILLAMNNQGYENLMRLSSIAQLEGFYYKPRIDHALLEKYNEGLIALSACLGGEVADALHTNQDKKAEEVAAWYKGVFGDRYYIELQDHEHEWDTQKTVNTKLKALAQKLDIKMVVTSDAHYCEDQDQEAHEILLCVQTSSLLEDTNRMSLRDMHLFVSDPKDVASRWRDMPEVMTNTKEIADRCNVELEFGQILIPTYPTPSNLSEQSYLEQLAYQGLAWRYGKRSREDAAKLSREEVEQIVDDHVLARLEYELGVIDNMGFNGYFLIIWDFVNWGKEQGIIFGPGRGSASGSIVSYCLNITTLDPLKYNLLFERFLNPDRISMPDIDIDIEDDRRDEVIKYVTEKYGSERVANIVTFGKMAARNAIRDTARVMGVPYADADRIAKLVPPPVQGRHIPLATSLKNVKELKEEYNSSPNTKKVIDNAIRLEGTIRSHGVHAAGVVIAPNEIVKFVPLEMAQKGVVSTQYSMGPIEDLGLLKMDFLGLSNLTIIKNALRIIKKVYQQEINLETLVLDDPKTFKLLQKGDTTGVFQLESAGMKRYLKQLKPTEFDDIVAMGALYRPGPMQWIDDFIARKHGRKEVEYLHERMENALKSTYGIIVYQEQVMQISRELCGFTGGQSDTLRKAIGKKKPEEMAKMKKDFIEGAIKTSNVERAMMEEFWGQLEAFAAYAFPRAHAACYGLTSYHTAYLKANYPSAFMAALMTSDFEDTDRLAIELAECKYMGIEVLPPDVNESYIEFGVVPNTGKPGFEQIRFGLSAIKNVGVGAVECILEERAKGKFKSVEDFAARVSTRLVNRKAWESLIKAGAFDSLGDRGQLLFNLDAILAFGSKLQKDANSDQVGLFGDSFEAETLMPSLRMEEAGESIGDREKLQWERELLGLYLSSHPLDDYEAYLADKTTSLGEITTNMENQSVKVGGIVNNIRKITTKTGSSMAFVKIEDKSSELELILFPKAYEQYVELLVLDKAVLVSGKVNSKDRDGKTSSEIKIFVDKMREINHDKAKGYKAKAKPAKTQEPVQVNITVSEKCDPVTLMRVKDLLQKYQGDNEVVVFVGESEPTPIKLPFKVGSDPKLIEQLQMVEGVESVILEKLSAVAVS